jgi:hypothetical protein
MAMEVIYKAADATAFGSASLCMGVGFIAVYEGISSGGIHSIPEISAGAVAILFGLFLADSLDKKISCY